MSTLIQTPADTSSGATRPGKRKNARDRADMVAKIGLSVLLFISLFPYAFMILSSVKDNAQLFHSYWAPTTPFHFENYVSAWNQIKGYLLNSILTAVASTIGVLIISSIVAFVFARYRFPGRNLLFLLIAALLMVPFISSLIPFFVLVRNLGWLNTRLALIVPYIISGSILGIFLMRTFIEQIPEELFEAARIDGASVFQLYSRIMLPLSGPILGTVTMLTIINVWNDYFWPLLTITDDSLRTVTIGLAFFQGEYTTLWGPLFAGYLIASLPLLLVFAFASRYFIAGIQGITAN